MEQHLLVLKILSTCFAVLQTKCLVYVENWPAESCNGGNHWQNSDMGPKFCRIAPVGIGANVFFFNNARHTKGNINGESFRSDP